MKNLNKYYFFQILVFIYEESVELKNNHNLVINCSQIN